MAVTNLLDRLAEEYEGNHPVEYRAPLVKPLKKIVGAGMREVIPASMGGDFGPAIYEYKIGGEKNKGQSARDIIRDRMEIEKYPLDVLENQKTKKRIDESKNWDFAVVDNSRPTFPGFEAITFNAENKTEAKKKLKNLKEQGLLDDFNDVELVSNLKSNRKSARQVRDLDEFKKAFGDVRAQRDTWNSKNIKGDPLGYDDYSNVTPKRRSRMRRDFLSFESDMANPSNSPRRYYGVEDWNEWLAAKNASKKAGENLAKIFSEQNKREKAAYAEIQNTGKSNFKGDYVAPENSRPIRALGNQNHEYADDPDNAAFVENPISALWGGSHRVRYENGIPVVDMFTWTQIPNIEKIKKTGYLATVGSDTKHFHPGTKGMWTADKDTFPMGRNFSNGVDIGSVGPNGETFDEELLHTRIPMSMYNKLPVHHQGVQGSNTRVDIIKANPGAPEVAIGSGKERKLEKVAMRPEFMTHIKEDELRPDWSYLEGPSSTIPGWHPNKPWSSKTLDEGLTSILGEKEFDKYFYQMPNPSKTQRARKLIDLVKDKDNARKLLASSMHDLSRENKLRQAALGDYYYNLDLEGLTPYQIVSKGEHPPILSKGHVQKGLDDTGISWYKETENEDFPRTRYFLAQRDFDLHPLRDFTDGISHTGNTDGRAIFDPLFKNNLTKGALNNITVSGQMNRIVPKSNEYGDFLNQYLERIGANHINSAREEKESLGRVRYPKDFFNNKVGVDKSIHDAAANALKKSNFDEWAKRYISAEMDNPVRNEKDWTPQDFRSKKLRAAIENAKDKNFSEFLNDDDWKKYYKADSLDKVIGHTIGRRIGADRAKRGKKIF